MSIYVDGGYNRKLNIGGYGIVKVEEDNDYFIEEYYGYEDDKDNNYMEMIAYKKAREIYGKDVVIYTDSRYVIHNTNDDKLKWLKGHKNKWNILADRAANKAILNREEGNREYRLSKNFYIVKDRVCDIDINRYEYILELSGDTRLFFRLMLCEYDINIYEVFNQMKNSGKQKNNIFEDYIKKNYRKKYIKGNEECLKEIINHVWGN